MRGWTKLPVETARHRVTIAGRITDANTKQGITGAEVSIRPAGDPEQSLATRTTITLEDGRYYFMDRPAGNYQVEVSVERSIGHYRSGQASVNVPVVGERRIVGGSADIALQPVAALNRT